MSNTTSNSETTRLPTSQAPEFFAQNSTLAELRFHFEQISGTKRSITSLSETIETLHDDYTNAEGVIPDEVKGHLLARIDHMGTERQNAIQQLRQLVSQKQPSDRFKLLLDGISYDAISWMTKPENIQRLAEWDILSNKGELVLGLTRQFFTSASNITGVNLPLETLHFSEFNPTAYGDCGGSVLEDTTPILMRLNIHEEHRNRPGLDVLGTVFHECVHALHLRMARDLFTGQDYSALNRLEEDLLYWQAMEESDAMICATMVDREAYRLQPHEVIARYGQDKFVEGVRPALRQYEADNGYRNRCNMI